MSSSVRTVGLVELSGSTYAAEMSPHVLVGRGASAVVLLQMSIAVAPSVPSVVASLVSVESQLVTASSTVPSQSSSIMLPGTS